MNDFQIEFMQHLSLIQERNVQIALSKHSNIENLEDILYETTFDLITDILTLADGYDSSFKYKIKILNEDNKNIKEDPFIEFHDQVEKHLKYRG
ncbi:MAG: hypothetical protein K2H13_00565 [Eubacterium sp.]|nr:hypothetical protein [Eubacterium sp.]